MLPFQMQDDQNLLLKPSSSKSHFHITDFYHVSKVKYTLDFGDSIENKVLERSQFVYTLTRKAKGQIESVLMGGKHKKIHLDLGIHI